MGDGQRAGVVGRGGESRRILEDAEEVRLREDHAGGALDRLPELLGVGPPLDVRYLHDLQPEPRREGANDLPGLRVQRLG